ncbi:alginate export family protein [Larsenimonas rhizosphaerae]|uniref:Alginate export domain-containing protein n=1 Tax=Larsenimonas rhizosphaerae TaxID=2944682 RepID=A0AA41ZIQ1_9GAMM|nr:hypothetical protein [Larsenimonas rhizosphaerae]MCX2524954.1 hypothetical protein [Larsenimonas rhizosphaerae]
MNNVISPKQLRPLALSSSLVSGLLLASTAQAGTVTDVDLTSAGIILPTTNISLYDNAATGVRLSGGLTVHGFAAGTRNANFGGTREGAQPDKGPDWWEAAVIPSLAGEVDLPESRGTLFGGVSGSYGLTRGNAHGDVDGATPGHPEEARLKKSYLGWRSGDMLTDSLGEDAITFSFGRQTFQFGDGFLVGDAYSDTGKNAVYYIGPGDEFQSSAVLSLESQGWHGDLFHLKAHQYVSGGSDQDTSLNGVNVDYTLGDRAKFGAAYLDIYDSDIDARDGMEVYNLRAKGIPLASLPGLALGGQYVYETNNRQNVDDHAWYGQVTYTFLNTPWTPEIAYRYAEFSQGYDPLFYSFAGGWGSWYFGEVVGEYMLFNSNLKVDMVKASIRPHESLETGLIGYRFRYDETPQGISSRDFAREVDLYADWTVTDHFSISGVYGVAFPDDGAKQSGLYDDHTSQLVELFATYSF